MVRQRGLRVTTSTGAWIRREGGEEVLGRLPERGKMERGRGVGMVPF
jgi:hypothetical protein